MKRKQTSPSLTAPRIGLALSGGAVRGLAHIGVIKALAAHGLVPTVIAGTSVGSLIGAALAAGKDWQGIARMAEAIFWPHLLNEGKLEAFCRQHLPATFRGLQTPLTIVTTAIQNKKPVLITSGDLASAISASCALPLVRRPVKRNGIVLEDGGTSCVMPAEVCRRMGAELVIAVDVWGYGWCLRTLGCNPERKVGKAVFPKHYLASLAQTDILIRPRIPFDGYIPGRYAVNRMVAVGERAALEVLNAGF
ncbi:MAG: patatin-like phospholipase family protein [Blastocatellia bacterium]|nr:patatin-like phospholipase family protein [Blastocatellia bacterium]